MAKKEISKKALEVKSNSKGHSINTELNDIDYDSKKGKLAFEFVANSNCSITDWQGNELKLLIECFKKVESLIWKDIYNDSGLKYERNKNIAIPLPKNLPKDAKLCSMRVSDKMRIYGYRAQEYFYIIWFDKNHIVCPMNKPKKYTA